MSEAKGVSLRERGWPHYTPDEAAAYRRIWGELPRGYNNWTGLDEVEHRRILAWGAQHALCGPAWGGEWVCRHATAGDKGCGTLWPSELRGGSDV